MVWRTLSGVCTHIQYGARHTLRAPGGAPADLNCAWFRATPFVARMVIIQRVCSTELLGRGAPRCAEHMATVSTPETRQHNHVKVTMNPFGMCMSWKVIARLGILGMGDWAVVPNLVAPAPPVLLTVACPLSMLLVIWGIGSGSCATHGTQVSPSVSANRTANEQRVAARAQREAIGREVVALEAAGRVTSNEPDLGSRAPQAMVKRWVLMWSVR